MEPVPSGAGSVISNPQRLRQALVSRPEEFPEEFSTLWPSVDITGINGWSVRRRLWQRDLRKGSQGWFSSGKFDAKVSSAPQHWGCTDVLSTGTYCWSYTVGITLEYYFIYLLKWFGVPHRNVYKDLLWPREDPSVPLQAVKGSRIPWGHPTHLYHFVPQHSAAHTACTFPPAVTGCRSHQSHRLTAGLWKPCHGYIW